MAGTIKGKALTTIDIAADGSRVRLNLTDAEDHGASLELPLECVKQLIMTLPHIVTKAIRAGSGDLSARLVFPLDTWQLERAEGDARLILTLNTPDGFEVAFAVELSEIERMQRTAESARGLPSIPLYPS